MRYALYFTPPRDHPLTRAAATWLGRDAFSGLSLPRVERSGLALGEIAYFTASPRRYGFHATLKAPFQLVEAYDESDLVEAVNAFCRGVTPVTIPRITIGKLGGFFAVVPADPNPMLNEFANRVVAEFDKLRAPLTDKEFERRNPEKLSTVQLRNLQNWGYPYVFDEFRFHMSLTGHIDPADQARVGAALENHFAPVLDDPLHIDHLAVFEESEPGAPFQVHSIHEIKAAGNRRIA